VRVEEGQAGTAEHHWLRACLADEAQDERYSLTRSLNVRFEASQTMVFELFRQTPAKVRYEPGLSLLDGFVVVSTRERNMLLHTHDLDMVEVLGRAAYYPVHGVHLTFLDNPTLCLGHDSARSPFGQRTALEDEPSGD